MIVRIPCVFIRYVQCVPADHLYARTQRNAQVMREVCARFS